MTYKELQDRISKMTEEEKSQEVAVWGEDFPLRRNCQLTKNDEDMYYNHEWGDDSCCPKSMLPEEDAEDPDTFLVFKQGQYYIGVNLESPAK